MLPGYNHNVKYADQVFHVQTEDSGIQNPHIITHLFVGGNIIESRKTSYADIVDAGNLNEMLVELMQGQHKGMLRDLVRGTLNDKIAIRSVNAATLNGPAPINVDAGAQQRVSLLAPTAQARVPVPPPVEPAPGDASSARDAPAPPLPPQRKPPRLPDLRAPTKAVEPERPETDEMPSSFFGSAPPATSVIKVLEAATLEAAFNSEDDDAVDSIFGEDLITDRSLDEVILSYLAEDSDRGP